ncbi:actin-like ATPase domain-containing protein [Irpex rosettiformis]|uniref:Actin-like ATPase domain-containing protein n=1 Tax=Irpex rosettiformis TaxID=378272 RepID=A0ACB8TR74_9APHY|nr:actin-like ATPase domain-containing protein [Irpex rosettiformis]
MSSNSFRDSLIVIIDTSRTLIRAGHGLHDLLRTPSVTLTARVGLRRTVNGDAQQVNGDASGETSASTSKLPELSVKVTDYLVGAQLDEALAAGQEIDLYWPFSEGEVSDWTQAEALWKHTLFSLLHLRRIQMESPVLLTFFPSLSRSTYQRLSQLFFERFNVAAFSILERPIAQFYAALTSNTDLSGLVVDIDDRSTDIYPIHDNLLIHNAHVVVDYGIRDCEHYLAHLLLSNSSVVSTLSPAENPLSSEQLHETLVEVARQVWQEGLVKVLAEGEAADLDDEGVTDIAAVVVAGKEKAVIESSLKKRASQKASAAEQARAKEIEALDLVTIEFKGKSLTLGKERHRFCEPLFDPSLLREIPGIPEKTRGQASVLPLQNAVGHAVSLTEVDARQYIYQGLFVTGELTNHIKGLGAALQTRLAPFILSTVDQQNEVQPKGIRVLKISEYFAEYREKGDGLAAFLGASIIAKITFVNDSSGKNFVSKADYAEKGPKAIIEMSPALL